MGILYEAACPACDYKRSFCLGSGLGGRDLVRSIRALEPEQQAQILQMQERKEIFDFSAENRLVRCSHCPSSQGLMEKTIVTITDMNRRQHVFGDRCRFCGNVLEIYEEQVAEKEDEVVCPKCGKGFLIFSRAGFWD